MVKFGEILYRRSRIFRLKRIDNYQFYLHAFREHTFYINTCMTACRDAGGIFGKACQIRCQLNEYTIAFNRANNSGHGFARSKFVGILLHVPSSSL